MNFWAYKIIIIVVQSGQITSLKEQNIMTYHFEI